MNGANERDAGAKAQQSARVERVLGWRKYIATLEEEDFFEIIRIYLGEVPTPYNKQDLVEELSAFLRKEENKKGIIRLLSGIDLKLLAAVRFIPKADVDKLAEFFSPAMSRRQVAAHVDNLIQRLLVFHTGGDEKRPDYLCLTPLLEDRLLEILDIDILLPSYQGEVDASAMEALDAGKAASLMSYILAHPDLTKSDGSFKKKSAEEIAEKMGDTAQMQLLLNAFRNLGIFNENESGKKLLADWDRAESFASLDAPGQRAYLCAANIGHLSRGSMYDSAQLLHDTLQCAKDRRYGREALLRLSFLIKQNKQARSSDWTRPGRFQSLISRNSDGGEEKTMAAAMDAAIAFGYVAKVGTDGEGEDIYAVNPAFFERHAGSDRKKESVKIDAAFSFMIMPGLSFAELLPLVKFLDLVKYDRVLGFEVNKKSAMRSFDTGMTAQTIKATLAQYTDYPIPQNLEVTLDDWFGSYSSASLYRGYVLKVSGENEILVRKNPLLSRHIIETFAPGLYLLDFTDDIMAQAAIKQCGLDFIGKIKSKETDRTGSSFFSLDRNADILAYAEMGGGGQAARRPLKKEQDELLEALKAKVNAMKIPQEQKDGLLFRIDRRVIVSEDQLRPESVRFEKLEALGMDYQGKVHVIENSMLAKCLVELTSGEGAGEAFLGEPVALSKYEGEAEVTLRREDGREKTFSVSKASLVRKVGRQLSF